MSFPDFMLGECSISWKRASHRVLVIGDETEGLVEDAFIRLKSYLESYTRKNGTSLLISDGKKLYLHATAKVRQSLEAYVSECVLDHQEIGNESMYKIEDDLGSLIILIGPGIHMADKENTYGIEYDALDEFLTKEIEVNEFSVVVLKEIEENSRNALRSLWRRARVLSIAAFAVVPVGLYSFYEIHDAFTKFNLFRVEHNIPKDAALECPDVSVKVVRMFQDMVAVRSDMPLAWESCPCLSMSTNQS